MKKPMFVLMFFVTVLFITSGIMAAVNAPKKEAPPVIKSAMQLAEELQKRGVTGMETDEGILAKIFSIMGLRESRGITSHDYSLVIYDFKSAAGFNTAAGMFSLFTVLTDENVYKSRPYIITLNFQTDEAEAKVTGKLKEIIPDIKRVSEKEF